MTHVKHGAVRPPAVSNLEGDGGVESEGGYEDVAQGFDDKLFWLDPPDGVYIENVAEEATEEDRGANEQPATEEHQQNKIFRPIQPTEQEIELHRLTHVPCRSWCVHCSRGKQKSPPHKETCNSATPINPARGFYGLYVHGWEKPNARGTRLADQTTIRISRSQEGCLPQQFDASISIHA